MATISHEQGSEVHEDNPLRSTQPESGETPAGEYSLRLRIVIVEPPPGVDFCLQNDEGRLVSVTQSTGADIPLDFDVIVRPNRQTKAPNFTGPFAKGTPSKRFFYVNIGQFAGQSESPWERRSKIWISDISWESVLEVASNPDKVLMARYAGSNELGEPTCANRELLDGGWVVSQR